MPPNPVNFAGGESSDRSGSTFPPRAAMEPRPYRLAGRSSRDVVDFPDALHRASECPAEAELLTVGVARRPDEPQV